MYSIGQEPSRSGVGRKRGEWVTALMYSFKLCDIFERGNVKARTAIVKFDDNKSNANRQVLENVANIMDIILKGP